VRITAKAEYACLALIALARRDREKRPIHIREIAHEEGIPESTLTQILVKLKRAGLVRSTRGSTGGYSLAHPPEEITLGRILLTIDGDNGATRELQGSSARVLASVWAEIRATERKLLEQTSIAQLAGRSPTYNWVI
jgi:Rrf2 family transcriptional regulator, cysteine metabolism repressor